MLVFLSAKTASDEVASQFGQIQPGFPADGFQGVSGHRAAPKNGPHGCAAGADGVVRSWGDFPGTDPTDIRTISPNRGQTLTETIARVIGEVQPRSELRILYGDGSARLPNIDLDRPDVVALKRCPADTLDTGEKPVGGRSGGAAKSAKKNGRPQRIACGYFNISDPELFRSACAEATIAAALRVYAQRKALEVLEVTNWYEIGGRAKSLRSSRSPLVSRAFNSLSSDGRSVVKVSTEPAKMRAEANWYENLPDSIRAYTPTYRGRVEQGARAGYVIDHVHHPHLSELFVFGDLSVTDWRQALTRCFELLDEFRKVRPAEGTREATPEFARSFFSSMFIDKNWSRLSQFCGSRNLPLDASFKFDGVAMPPLQVIVEHAISAIPATLPDDVCFWHGDLFFGNLFYDAAERRILCIDPRGMLESGDMSLFGDYRYDVAKLAHSVVGFYDKTVLARSTLIRNGPRDWSLEFAPTPHEHRIQDIFLSLVNERTGLHRAQVYALAGLLFLSMLPLHYDDPDRQDRLLASGFRMYREMRKSGT